MTFTAPDADRLAEKYHSGLVDKQGLPQVDHVRAVEALAWTMGATETQRMAALLHDVIEDTDATYVSLAADGVPADVLLLVGVLTRQGHESYERYIDRVAQSPRAAEVKLCDILANLVRLPTLGDEGEEARLMAKYARAWTALGGPVLGD